VVGKKDKKQKIETQNRQKQKIKSNSNKINKSKLGKHINIKRKTK